MNTPSTPAPRISSPEAKVKSLPCQFCGPAAATYVKQNGRFTFQVVCYGGCAGPKASSETEAITAWNACRILSSLAPSSPAGEPEGLDEAMDAALTFAQPKLIALKKEKGLVGVWCNAFRAGWEALSLASPVPPPLPGEAVAWRWKQKGRTDRDAWVYVNAEPRWMDRHVGYVIEPLYATPPARAPGITEEMVERENVLKLAAWCENERGLLGAVDGYDYRSGEEYGLRRAQLQAEKLARAIPSTDHVGGGE